MASASSSSSTLSLLLRRSLPLLRSRSSTILPLRRTSSCLSTLDASHSIDTASPPSPASSSSSTAPSAKPPCPPPTLPETPAKSWADHPDYRRWKDQEEEILKDILPVVYITKEILHSDRYMDGERLCADDEKVVVKNLLAYHPHSEDKIGCGLDYIMVDRHPTFRNSRCLFVVRTDGGWIDFSYQKCLRAFIREKYPSYAERFIQEHFKRT